MPDERDVYVEDVGKMHNENNKVNEDEVMCDRKENFDKDKSNASENSSDSGETNNYKLSSHREECNEDKDMEIQDDMKKFGPTLVCLNATDAGSQYNFCKYMKYYQFQTKCLMADLFGIEVV